MMVHYSFQSAKRYTGYTVGAILMGILSMTTNGCADRFAKSGKSAEQGLLSRSIWWAMQSVLRSTYLSDCLLSQALLLVCYFR